jgi:glycosyltransferase involved in cell wall biosynthesis
MKIAILSHNLTSNAAMRAHRLGLAARRFAEVTVFGPAKHRGAWGALPQEPWIHALESKNLPKFFKTALELILACEADVVIAVKPYLASFGLALLAGECRRIPVVLDIDDLDVELAPKVDRGLPETLQDLRDPASTIYLRILSRSVGAAAAITVASTRLQAVFGGTLVPHGCPTEQMNPALVDREQARKRFGFAGPVVVFPGTRRTHKGLKPLAKAVSRIAGARLAVLCRPDDFTQPEWDEFPLIRIPLIPYASLPDFLAAGDVVAIPQLDTVAASHQMPMKVYDAMAMGKPIVASTVSDLPQVLDGCARLVPPGDVSSLAKAIRDLLDHPREAEELGQRARARCLERYSLEQVAESLRSAIVKAGVSVAS